MSESLNVFDDLKLRECQVTNLYIFKNKAQNTKKYRQITCSIASSIFLWTRRDNFWDLFWIWTMKSLNWSLIRITMTHHCSRIKFWVFTHQACCQLKTSRLTHLAIIWVSTIFTISMLCTTTSIQCQLLEKSSSEKMPTGKYLN